MFEVVHFFEVDNSLKWDTSDPTLTQTLSHFITFIRSWSGGSWCRGKLIWWELTSWELMSWELMSWEVDLVGVDLVGVDFVGVNLVGMNLLCSMCILTGLWLVVVQLFLIFSLQGLYFLQDTRYSILISALFSCGLYTHQFHLSRKCATATPTYNNKHCSQWGKG